MSISMKRLTRGTIIVVVVVVVAALLGAGVGFYFGGRGSSGKDPMIDLFTTAQSRYSSYVFGVRKEGNQEVHEDELHSYLAFLEAHARAPGAPTHLYAFDRAIALIRLSQIAESRGATGEAARMRTDAEALCPSTELRNCSAITLLATVRVRDLKAWGNPASIGSR